MSKMNFTVGSLYQAKVLFERTVNTKGEAYLVIFGRHINGCFCCIPNMGWGCEMAEADDVLYNTNSLIQCGADFGVAQNIAEAIKQTVYHSK